MSASVVKLPATYDVYVGRPSMWENPFRIVEGQRTRDEAITEFEPYLRKRLESCPELRRRFEGLRGKRLGCHCGAGRCHGDVLVKLLDELPPIEAVSFKGTRQEPAVKVPEPAPRVEAPKDVGQGDLFG